jgi:small-conductance mechanosensitive channel
MAFMEWWDGAHSLVNTIASAVIALLIGFIIGKVLGKLTQRALHAVEVNAILAKAGVRFGLEEFLGHTVEYVIYFVTVVIALDQLGVTTYVLYILATAVLVIIAIAFLLGIKDFIPNFIAGIRLAHKKYYKAGDTITVGTVTGKVKEFGLLETKVAGKNGDIIHIPNATLIRQEVRVRKR